MEERNTTLSARSAVLSALLGSHPPRLPARHLVRIGALFGIAEGTVRVALSRMLAAGDLLQSDGQYTLSRRLVERQARQDESRDPHPKPWDGTWEVAVVTAERRAPAERAAFRHAMLALRLAELREGTWMRPANLARAWPEIVTAQCTLIDGRPHGDPTPLLWDLDGWASEARRLERSLGRAEGLAEGFLVSAAVLRHLLADPLLPPELLPAGWPGAELRAVYDDFDRRYREVLRHHLDG
ncbi:PaaX family transcriptional regulator C-terminal domain-containing protein [Nonomuraea fuscirosea]|jgi:phenylacetic acid degradation operon negative regulatory protein|uniref:PaaX family transcriptional regulator C-terminal domain-containing protein n=1 Tax=Nonomuraea fuscirosea TaxID=1291556 RepID=UPI002DD91430|nr:PaaX family transcriptional regulator C-terminal domain-containing protein [Nonomuraea fuscirosea]WSA54834.1 PaaX domain-containing protein, C- domain protein [Nonomuraea fuscirosea]